MNTQEQDYADNLYNLGSASLAAASWDRVLTGMPANSDETAYYNYWVTLNPFDKGESEYLIFSDLFDRIDVISHLSYETEFGSIGYSLDAVCKRKKGTPH